MCLEKIASDCDCEARRLKSKPSSFDNQGFWCDWPVLYGAPSFCPLASGHGVALWKPLNHWKCRHFGTYFCMQSQPGRLTACSSSQLMLPGDFPDAGGRCRGFLARWRTGPPVKLGSPWPHDLYELTSCKRQQSRSFKTCNCRLVSAGEISSLSSCRSPRRPELHACKLPGMRCTQCGVLSSSIKMRMTCPFCMQWWHLGQACMPE